MIKWQDVGRQLAVALAGALVALTLEPATAPAALRAVCALLPAGPAVAQEVQAAQSALKWYRHLQTQ